MKRAFTHSSHFYMYTIAVLVYMQSTGMHCGTSCVYFIRLLNGGHFFIRLYINSIATKIFSKPITGMVLSLEAKHAPMHS